MNEISEKEIEFIGKITAGVTHEINNALASIKEMTGLLEDLMSMSSTDLFPHKEKFLKVIPRMKEHVERSVQITAQLNKFSHLTDKRSSEVEINNIVEHLILLTQRFARLKNVELQYQPFDEAIKFSANPVHLQMALYNCIMYFLNKDVGGGSIIIHPNIGNKKYSLQISFEGEMAEADNLFNDSSSEEELLVLSDVISSLNGNIEFDKSSKRITLEFNLQPG